MPTMTLKSSKAAAKPAASRPPAPTRSTAKPPATRKLTPGSPRTAATAGQSNGNGTSLTAGQIAPDFALPDDRGQLVRLSNYRGRKVVLYFYPEDDTPACTREACAFRDRFGDIQLHGAVILGVSADPVESHRKFKAKYRLNFPLLSDADRKVLKAYDVWQEKTMFGRTYMGVVRSTFIIDETGRIAKVFSKVKVDGHADEVVAAL